MNVTEWYAAKSPGFVRELARAERSDDAANPWVVLAYQRSTRGGWSIVAGYNRLTGDEIYWNVTSFDYGYDMSNAVELTP